MDNQFKFVVILAATISLVGCQGVGFRTNLTPAYVVDSYETSKVVEYSAEEVYNHDSQMIGDVRAAYCQTLSNPAPSYAQVVDVLKYKVQQLGGNGIVVMECSKVDPLASCKARLECRALAYEVNFS